MLAAGSPLSDTLYCQNVQKDHASERTGYVPHKVTTCQFYGQSAWLETQFDYQLRGGMGASLPCRRLPGHWQQHSRHVGARIVRERLDKGTYTV